MGKENEMSSSRRRYNRSMFAVASGRTPQDLVALLAGEDIELLVDARRAAADRDRLASLCAEEHMYFSVRPELAELAEQPQREPDEDHAWAARMAMRHRTCVLTDVPGVAEAIADLVGLRVIDLNRSPAPIALTAV